MPLPGDYAERIYAGVLGKLIGVYLGRPVEGWTYDRILHELEGEIRDYVNDRIASAGPIVVTDDDISGTFTFLRALDQHPGSGPDLSAEQIGQTWLNEIIESRTTLWWGGMGASTEHTAYLRLKQGIAAPRSGSIELNGRTVAEQIGAQIFIDGWAMVAPGNASLAAALAQRAAGVSHDGEAVYAAQVIAAMEAMAFVERDINRLLDTGLSFIPRDCTIRRLIEDLRKWHGQYEDWHRARALLEANYGYHLYPGACHVVPNHGVVILALLYGGGDFTDSLMIAATSGWDTDCNCGNVGCLLGIRNGLAGIRARWREPVIDRMYLPGAAGGECITDAVQQADAIANRGRALAGEAKVYPKDGARYHFSYPGSLQGFVVSPPTAQASHEARRLRVDFGALAHGAATASVATFIPPEAANMPGYALVAAPALYPGQTLRARVAAQNRVMARLSVGTYHADQIARRMGPPVEIAPGEAHTLEWTLPDFGEPIATAGITFDGRGPVDVDWLTWDGEPNLALRRPSEPGTMWRRAWVNAVTTFADQPGEDFTLIQNEGRGLLMTGSGQWKNIRIAAPITARLAKQFGVAARVQGLRRFYALLLCDDQHARLIRAGATGDEVLAECRFAWEIERAYAFSLQARADRLTASIDGKALFDVTDAAYATGGIALVLTEGRCAAGAVRIQPA